MAQIANFTINISDIEAKLESLAARRKAAASANQPPPSIGLPTPPSAKSFSADPNKAIADIARVQGVALAANRQLRNEDRISAAQFTANNKAIKAESAAALGNNTLAGPASGVGVGGKIESLEQGRMFQTIANQTLAEATRAYAEATSQTALQASITALLKKEQAIQSADNELASRGLLSRQENAQLAADRTRAVRAQISKLQEGAGLEPDGGPTNATTPELIALKNKLAADEAADAAAAKKAANQANKAAEEQFLRTSYLSSEDLKTARPTADLRADATAEGKDMAFNRQIAVAFGRAKQEQYSIQIRENAAFREDYAKEQSLRQARLAIQESLVAKELLKINPDGTSLLDDKVRARVDNAQVGAALDTDLAGNDDYIDAKAQSARAHAQEAAAIASQNVSIDDYINDKAQSARASAAEAAKVSTINASLDEYIASKAESARASALEAAKVGTVNVELDAYINSKAEAARNAAIESAKTSSVNVGLDSYIEAKAESTRNAAIEAAKVSTLNVGLDAYIESKAESARNAAIESAKISTVNVGLDQYINAKAESARNAAIESAKTSSINVALDQYINAKAESARNSALEAAKTSTINVGLDQYINAKAESARNAATEAAKVSTQNVQLDSYINAKAESARNAALEAAKTSTVNVGLDSYINAKAESARNAAAEAAKIATQNVEIDAYIKSKAASARAAAKEAAQVAEQNSVNTDYIASKGRSARAEARSAALIADQNSRLQSYIDNKALSARAAVKEAAKVAEQNAAIDDYIQDKARSAAAHAKEAASVAEAAALNSTAIADKARTAAANASEQASISNLTSQNTALAASKATSARNAAIEAAAIAESNAINPQYIAAKAQSARALAIESAGVLSSNASDPAYIAAKAQAARAHTVESLNTLRQTTQQDIANQAELATTRTSIETQRRILTTQAQMSESALALKAQERVLQREYNAALNNRIADQLAASGASRLEVAQARQGHGTGVGGGPQDAGGLFGGGLLNTVKYAVPSILLFGAASGLAESVKQAQELQLIFAQLEAQADALNESTEGASVAGLEGMKKSILEIAAESGYASTEVANLAFQFQGAFGGDTQKTLRETEAAVQAVVITGLTLTETIDAFTAITQSFKSTDVSIEDVTDTALGLQGRFGVLAKETISFAADLAPVGAQIGLTVRELETLGAVAQKYSGRSGSELAEAFGRILPSLQKNAVDIIQIFEGIDGGAIADELTVAFASGQTGDAFQGLIKSYGKLDDAQKNQIISQLGGRREAAALIPILENSEEYFKSLANSQDDAGRSAAYYAKAQETLSRQIAELTEKLKQLAIALFNGGLGQALDFLASGATGLLAAFMPILDTLTKVNELTKGWLGTVVATVAALKVLAGAVTIAQGAMASLGTRIGVGAAARQAAIAPAVAQAATFATVAGVAPVAGQPNWTSQGGTMYVNPSGTTSVPGASRLSASQPLIYGVQPLTKPLGPGGDLDDGTKKAATGLRRLGQSARAQADQLGGLAIAGAVLALGNLVDKINELRAGADKQVQSLEQRILSGNTAEERQREIDALRKAGESYSFKDRFVQQVGFGTSPEAAAERIEAKSRAGGNAAGLRALLDVPSFTTSAGNRDELEELVGKVKNGVATDEEYERVRTILNQVKEFDEVLYNDVILPKMAEAQKIADETKQQSDASKQRAAESVNSLAGLDVAGIKSAVASGDASIGQALATLNGEIDTYERLLAEDPKALANIEDAAKKYQDAKKAVADLISNAAYQEAQGLIELNALGSTTEGETSQFEIDALERALASGRLNPADSTAAVEKLLQAKKAYVNYKAEEAQAAGNIAEVLRLQNEGDALTVDTQVVLTANALLSNTAFVDYTSGLDPTVGEALNKGGTAIATLIETQGLNLKEATIEFLFKQAEIDKAKARLLELGADADRALAQSAAEANEGAKDRLERGEISPELADERQKESDAANRAERDNKEQADAYNTSADEAYKAAEELLSGEAGAGLEEFDGTATASVVKADKEALEKAKKSRNGWYDYLRALAADNPVLVAEINVQEAQANLAASTAEDYQSNLAALINAQRGVRDAMRAVSASYGDYLQQLVSDDPVASAQQGVANAQRALAEAEPNTAAYNQAASALDQAYKTQRDAEQGVLDARDTYAAALVSGDPVKAAQQAQATADRHILEANNEAERLQAMAEKLSADRAMQEALQAIYDAQANLLTAAAEYVGDTVRASEIGLAETQRKLREVEAKYSRGEAGEADVIQAKADVIRATGAARDALIAKKRDDYAFQYEMGQITKSQYIQYLESLKGLADGNQTIIRDLDRQIKQLKDELGADLQFNLPTNLVLPTLYEARRLNQSVGPDGSAGGYQDNRVVDINIIVNNGMDVQALQTILGDALGGQRFGNQARRY